MAVELYHFWSSVCSVRCRMALAAVSWPDESGGGYEEVELVAKVKLQ